MPHMNRSASALAISCVLSLCVGARSLASPVIVSAMSSWTYDDSTKRYTYTYSVTNSLESPNQVETFGVWPAAPPISTTAPTGWMAFRGWQGDSSAVVWVVIDPGSNPPHRPGQLFLGPAHIAPGETQGGFQIVSDAPPAWAETAAQEKALGRRLGRESHCAAVSHRSLASARCGPHFLRSCSTPAHRVLAE